MIALRFGQWQRFVASQAQSEGSSLSALVWAFAAYFVLSLLILLVCIVGTTLAIDPAQFRYATI